MFENLLKNILAEKALVGIMVSGTFKVYAYKPEYKIKVSDTINPTINTINPGASTIMHIHIAIFRWKEGVSDQEVTAALKEVETLQDKVPGIVEISTGQNYSAYNEGYTHVVLVRGDNQGAIDAYRKHPDHERAAKNIEAMEEHGIGVDFVTNKPN